MEIRELEQSDIEKMKDKSISRGILDKMPPQIDFSFCLENEGTVLAIGGILLITETTAWAWLDLSEDSLDYTATVYRTVKDWMEKLVAIHKIKRLQAYVECDFAKGVRMVKHLGFIKEHIMPRFVGEKSAYLYVKHYEG